MICEVHVGSGGNAFDPAWASHPDTMVLRQLGAAGGWQSALLMLNGMVFSGVFDRHPNLTLLFAEYGLHWFAGAVEHMEARGPAVPESSVYMGTYTNELTPGETVRRNVRITPLPRPHQPVPRTLDLYPECVVFSSDYAHNESNPEPTAYYEEQLAAVDPARKQWFLGANIVECFARTGDPLPV
jgi:predicted TIM-barrel fold metal-dependent hydrolase